MSETLPNLAETVAPDRTALLVVDVQRFFTRTQPGAMFPPVEDVHDTQRRFIDTCRERGVLVVRIQAIIPDEATSGVWRRHFKGNWPTPSPLGPDHPMAQFHPGFEPLPGDIVVTKPRYSSFNGTSLESTLRSRGIRTVLVAGLTTDVCVSSTSRDAFQHEFDTVTLKDCTAARNQA